MNEDIRKLEPQEVWNNFADLNAVPRPSKKEGQVIDFIMAFGKKLGLPVTKDETGNVIITKPATAGMEGRDTVALQAHLDMVHQKNADTAFDFASQGIEMFVDGDWVRARGTTLGADNGMGVACIMTILASREISHPPLEAVFTIDEETGMTGALGLKPGMLRAKIMLNLDTEDDHELTIGCAGGVDVTATGKYKKETPETGLSAMLLTVKGLTGGHSGMDIHKGRGNANKLMNRILLQAVRQFGARIASIDGGGLRNAIPRESAAIIRLKDTEGFKKYVNEQEKILKAEYHSTDPGFRLGCEASADPSSVLEKDFALRLLQALYSCPNGISRMSPDIPGLVQTSNNLARVLVKDGDISVQCLTRSSVDTEKDDLAIAIGCVFELCGLSMKSSGSYPGWLPKPDAPVVKLMSGLYRELFKGEPLVDACHAGLECGIIGASYPGTQMISFGPNITGAHSPDEKVQVSSVQKFWKFLLEALNRMP